MSHASETAGEQSISVGGKAHIAEDLSFRGQDKQLTLCRDVPQLYGVLGIATCCEQPAPVGRKDGTPGRKGMAGQSREIAAVYYVP